MNRRELIKACAGVSVGIAAGFTGSVPAPVRRWGPITFERHRALCAQGIHLHVFHEGRDVTHDCRFADDTGEGMAELLLRNAEGKRYAIHDSVAMVIVHGVTISEGEPL